LSTYATPIPGAPQYQQANLLAKRAYEQAMARHQQKRSRSLQNYGYVRDATGNLGVDPNNEYGQYQQMLRGGDTASRRLDSTQRAGGWGTGSGYLGAQREDLQYQQGNQQRQLGTAFADELAGISQDEQASEYERDQALWQNEANAARDAINDNRFNPANYDGTDAPYGDEEDAPPPSVHKQGKTKLLKRAKVVRRARAIKGRRR
jgi:hypothetical protein